jgi:tryptophan-rich sensory protein
MKADIKKLSASVIVCLLAGMIGSIFTMPKILTWYATLAKPEFAPPNWVFGPVWTTLFVLMGISLYLIWNKGAKDKNVKMAIYVFAVQLALNILWSFLFFGLESPFYGFVGIAVLWAAIAATMWKFYGIDKKAAYLLMPYIAWVSFASLVNYAVWMLN